MSSYLSSSVKSILTKVRTTSLAEKAPTTAEPQPRRRLADFEKLVNADLAKAAPDIDLTGQNRANPGSTPGLEVSYAKIDNKPLVPIEQILFNSDPTTRAVNSSPEVACRSYQSNSPPAKLQPAPPKFEAPHAIETLTSVKTPTLDPAARFSLQPSVLGTQGLIAGLDSTTPGSIGSKTNIQEIIKTASRFYGLDPNLGLAIANTESSLDPKAVSSDGFFSKGLFQLLDETGHYVADKVGMNEKYDPFDPAQNTYLGIGYLKRLRELFSEENKLAGSLSTQPANSPADLEKLAIAAFNAGEGNVARAQQQAKENGREPGSYDAVEPFLPASTRIYVKRVKVKHASLNTVNVAG